MNIVIQESGMRICFRVNDDRTVELVDFSAADRSANLPLQNYDNGSGWKNTFKARQFLAVHVTGESATENHADKHDSGSVSRCWLYQNHTIAENRYGRLLTLSVKAPNGLAADYYMQFFAGLPIVRTWAELKNTGTEEIGIEYVSSFMYEGIGKNRSSTAYDHLEFYIPHNGWCCEAQWQKCDAVDLGLSHLPYDGYNLPEKGSTRYHYGSKNSWSTSEYLPVGMVRDPESGEIYYCQIDHSGSWEIEYGMGEGRQLYICLLGPNNESCWWKNLKPGDSFITVPAAFGVQSGEISEASAALTQYRRRIRRPNEDDEKCYVVFNDYMNCLFGDPTEEKEKAIIDRAAALGCEYYCLDAGWYDDGFWWDRVGEWKESTKRFPNGLKSVYDYAHLKGLRMGMWLEIESMGTECPLAKTLPDDWFVCTHGKRRIENERYLLDFRNPAVRQYCSDVIDRLITEYGCDYFKIDYNVTTGPGSDLYADSTGDAMLEHYRCLYDWIREIYARHPGLVIENCGSGGQRMDYGMLTLHSLQSTSDQTDYLSNACIAANVASAVAPEQAGMWVFPYEDDPEHVIFNMVNGILLRPYISGRVWNMSESSMSLLREGIETYKSIRDDVKNMVPVFPLGFGRVNETQLAYGLTDGEKSYLSVFTINNDTAEIPLSGFRHIISKVEVLYPRAVNCEFTVADNILKIKMPVSCCARLFRLETGTV